MRRKTSTKKIAESRRGNNRSPGVKRVKARVSRDERFAAMFIDEARLAASLHHPNIVPTLDFDRDEEGRLYLVMELIDGVTLDEWLTGYEGLNTPERIAKLHDSLAQILDALAYIHGQQIVHRDLKPENILVDTHGTIKLMDFGLIRQTTASSVSLTGDNVVGTLHYISPEQLDSRPVDARSDLYSLGAVLFELLTGEPPFAHETSVEAARLTGPEHGSGHLGDREIR